MIDVYEVVTKLIGPIDPIGETNEDNRRYENLRNLTQLVDRALSDIDRISMSCKDDHRFSIKRAGEHCSKFFDDLGIEE